MMSNACEDCDRLQDSLPDGNAPIRPPFIQPTLYDHFNSFKKFKEEKEFARELKIREEELLKLNKKFTDFEFNKKDDGILEKFSTQDIAKFRYNLKEGRFHKQPTSVQPSEGLWMRQHQLKPAVSKTIIARNPISCPVNKCGRTIGMTSLLSHFLRDHHDQDLLVEYVNLYAGGRTILLFKKDVFDFGENVCLGIISYGGFENQKESRPALRGICKQNSFLSKSFTDLANHLPILIMAFKTSMCIMLKSKDIAKELMLPEDTAKHVLIIWLATVHTTKPIFCTITAFNKSMTSSRSCIINVRSLDSNENLEDFIRMDTNYLMLNQGELNILSEEGRQSIRMEIKIHEFDE